MKSTLGLPLLFLWPRGVVCKIKQYLKLIKDHTTIHLNDWALSGGRKKMWAFLNTELFLLMLSYCSFSSAVSSPLYSTSCRLQGQFYLNGMHKAGDVILGGLFQIHFFSSYPDLYYTSKPQEPTCHGWVNKNRIFENQCHHQLSLWFARYLMCIHVILIILLFFQFKNTQVFVFLNTKDWYFLLVLMF